jgi:ketosteroid isomerase-like protein
MRTVGVIILVAALATTAFAEANTTARAHSEAFSKACGAGDIKAVMALYADDAFVIWPGAGEEARGKAAIEKLATGLCDPKLGTKAVLTSVAAVQLDPTHIAILGHWDFTQNGPDGKSTTSQIRTSEIIQKGSHGWVYLVDHASIGMPPPAPAK